MNDDFDDLDRALFALPLETPPQGLRDGILRATVFMPAAAPPAFELWEVAGIGLALAVAAWLVILAVVEPAFAAEFTWRANAFVRALADPVTLAWLAAGGSLAAMLSFSNLFPLFDGRR